MTVVWIEVRSLETKQAIGGQALDETISKPSLWLMIDEKNNVTATYKMPQSKEVSSVANSNNGQINWAQAKKIILSGSARKIENAHILPTKSTKYDHVIRLMDLLKQNGIKDIGLSPI